MHILKSDVKSFILWNWPHRVAIWSPGNSYDVEERQWLARDTELPASITVTVFQVAEYQVS